MWVVKSALHSVKLMDAMSAGLLADGKDDPLVGRKAVSKVALMVYKMVASLVVLTGAHLVVRTDEHWVELLDSLLVALSVCCTVWHLAFLWAECWG